MKSFFLLPALASIASAHFSVDFPEMRGDSFELPADQWLYPCANVNQTNANRTLWPLDGGSILLGLHHKWSYFAINLGLGDAVATFNISLTPELHNATGNGTLCIPKLAIPTGLVQEGTNASLQVVTFGQTGSALYNCADITFSAAATDPADDECVTNGVTVAVINPSSSTPSSPSSSSDAAASPTPTSGAAGAFRVREAGVAAGVLAAAVGFGLSGLV